MSNETNYAGNAVGVLNVSKGTITNDDFEFYGVYSKDLMIFGNVTGADGSFIVEINGTNYTVNIDDGETFAVIGNTSNFN